MAGLDELIEETGAHDCVECGKCTSVCPVARINPKFAPRLIVLRVLEGVSDSLSKDKDIWSCITCEMCNDMCPYEVNYSGFILGLRTRAIKAGNLPDCSQSGAVHTYQRLMTSGVKQNRLKWVTPEMKIKERGDVFYFTGCAVHLGALFSDKAGELKNTPANYVRILNAAGIEPVVSNDEVCCGHDLLWAGDEDSMLKLMDKNVEVIRKSGAKTVVFSCPECLRTFEIDYQDFLGDFDFELVHMSEFLLDLIDKGKLSFDSNGGKITYHDSCRLGRHLGIYDPPRDLISALGMELIEMQNNKEKAGCCGVNAFANCGEVSQKLQLDRLLEATATGADEMLTFCPKCVIHFNCLLKSPKLPVPHEKVKILVREFGNVLAEHLQKKGDR
ncbi:MAG: (Fe-S)-binding protein [Methanomassiliicoccales archaeon]|nr:(Fe-S)-binding protein [Methanomassiliicoccales archaeon]